MRITPAEHGLTLVRGIPPVSPFTNNKRKSFRLLRHSEAYPHEPQRNRKNRLRHDAAQNGIFLTKCTQITIPPDRHLKEKYTFRPSFPDKRTGMTEKRACFHPIMLMFFKKTYMFSSIRYDLSHKRSLCFGPKDASFLAKGCILFRKS